MDRDNFEADFDSIESNWKSFPNLKSSLGSYTFLNQLVHINSADSTSIRPCNNHSFSDFKKSSLVLVHELTHWADCLGTLWGRRLLCKLFSAMNARLLNTEKEFWRIADIRREIRRIDYEKYYQVVGQGSVNADDTPWVYQFSCGIEFSALGYPDETRPILFTSFYPSTVGDTKSGMTPTSRIIRVPFSPATLLETNAVASELRLGMKILEFFPPDTATVDRHLWLREVYADMYNVEITVYTAAAHCIANLCKVKDVAQAYLMASVISRFCLNLPARQYESLILPPKFAETWANRSKAILSTCNPAIAFLIVCYWAGPYEDVDIIVWLKRGIDGAGIADSDQLGAWMHEDDSHARSEHFEGPLSDFLDSRLRLGNRVTQGLRVNQDALIDDVMYCSSNIELPLVLLKDKKLYKVNGAKILDRDPEVELWFERSVFLNSQIREFWDACI